MAKRKINTVKKRLPVALIFGGEGAERSVSRMSAVGIAGALEAIGRDYIPVFIDARGFWFLLEGGIGGVKEPDTAERRPTFPVRLKGEGSGFLTDGKILRVSAAIPALHGDMGEDGVVQGALRCAGIPYLGSDTTAGALLMDKAYTKILAEYCGIPTVPWFLYLCRGEGGGERIASSRKDLLRLASELGYPLFVKPARSGSSIGAGRADNAAELISAVSRAARVCDRVIVERALISPTELECAYVGAGREDFLFPGSVVSRNDFYSFSRKYLGSDQVEISTEANIDGELSSAVRAYAERICRLAGVAHFARIDFLLSGGELYFNEVNTFPGMTESSLFPRMAENAGLPIGRLLGELLSGL